jgi:CHAT domain-containing protein
MPKHYFDIRLSKEGAGGYSSEVVNERNKAVTSAHSFEAAPFLQTARQIEWQMENKTKVDCREMQQFGHQLYQTIFGGEAGGYFKSQLRQHKKLTVRIRVDDSALELMRIPFELMYDGDRFLSTHPEVTLLRLPYVLDERNLSKKIDGRLRMLIIISNPKGLPQLNVDLEERMILEALDKLNAEQKIDIETTDDAQFSNIQSTLMEDEYHIIHYTGHGVFGKVCSYCSAVNERDATGCHKCQADLRGIEARGYLAFENDRGETEPIENIHLANLFTSNEHVRFVFLSGCQTATTSGRVAFSDSSTILLKRGVRAVLSMQYSVLDSSAIELARTFYTALANNKPIDEAIALARQTLQFMGPKDRMDFVTPVLFTRDVNALQVKESTRAMEPATIGAPKPFIFEIERPGRNFVGRRKQIKRVLRGFEAETKRAVVIHGLGGIGKTVLASKIAERMHKKIVGCYAMRCHKGLTPDQILFRINTFLRTLGIDTFTGTLNQAVPFEIKINYLAQILSGRKLLIIFDNFEDLLDDTKKEISSPDMASFLRLLLLNTPTGTKFLLTGRYTFDVFEEGRAEDAIDKIQIGEFDSTTALNYINCFDELRSLEFTTKYEIFTKTGGHPFTINTFVVHCRAKSPQEVLKDLKDVNQEVAQGIMLGWSFDQLSVNARNLIIRISVFQKAVPLAALQWMMGEYEEIPDDVLSPLLERLKEDPKYQGESNESTKEILRALLPAGKTVVDVTSEIGELTHWGLLIYLDEEEVYQVHTLVREFIKNNLLSKEERKKWLIEGARFYEDTVKINRLRSRST